MKHIVFHFDVISPYAYLAFERLPQALEGVTFIGRLATYRYLDMDVTIREALDAARGYLAASERGARVPVFYCDI